MATKVGVILATMVEPSEPAQQLQNKYTHELWIYKRGHCKYDRFHAQQDYSGFKNRGRKTWLDDFEFSPIPADVSREYDKMRQALADEVIIGIEDTMIETHLDYLVKRLQPLDLELIRMIRAQGPVYHKQVYSHFGDEQGKLILTRLKSRGVISPVRDMATGYGKYDLNEIAYEILKAVEQKPLVQETTVSTGSTNSIH